MSSSPEVAVPALNCACCQPPNLRSIDHTEMACDTQTVQYQPQMPAANTLCHNQYGRLWSDVFLMSNVLAMHDSHMHIDIVSTYL